MNRKNAPTVNDFHWLSRELIALGLGRISKRDIREDFDRYKIESIKPHPGGREEGYHYTHKSGYRVKVWTSFVLADNDYREFDLGWVLIVDAGDKIVYRAQITRRTTNFAKNLYMRARMAFERVHFRPYCNGDRGCGQWLHFIQRKDGGCFWRCKNEEFHGNLKNCSRKSPDTTLSPEVKTYAEEKRLDRKRDRKDPRRKTPRGTGMGNRKARFKKTRQPAH